MCGIVYAESFDGSPVNNGIMQVFDKQRHRGTEGFGLYDGQEGNMVHATKEDKILKWLVRYDSNMVLFHHRNPSSTINVKRAAHPFSTKDFFGDTEYILVHNGHIHNSYELADVHDEMGIPYHSVLDNGTFNDSEALLWDLALVLEGQKTDLEAEGAIAFICLKKVNGVLEKMYFGRNSNPLRIVRDEHRFELHSEGEGEMIEDNVLYTYNYKLKRLTQRAFTIPDYVRQSSVPYQSSSWEEEDWSRYGAPTYKPPVNTPVRSLPSGLDDEEDDQTWLPQHLKRRVAELRRKGLLNRNVEDDPNFIDYDAEGEPIYSDIREYKSYDDYYEKRKLRETRTTMLTDEQEEELEAIDVETEDAYQLGFEYLAQSDGNFEQAYFFAEQDYEQMFDTPEAEQDAEYLRQVRTMEIVMQLINSDPEYVDETSVSSTWLPLQQQMLINA